MNATTEPPIKTVDQVLEFIKRVDSQSIAWEMKKLRSIRDWAMKQIGVDYVVGDRVVIVRKLVSDTDRFHGWHSYREALAPGATAEVVEIDFSPPFDKDHVGGWTTTVRLDREWSVHSAPKSGQVRRYWNGSADETPEGMEPPSPYDQKHNPNGRRHVFSVRANDLRKYVEPAAEPCPTCGSEA